MRNKKKVIFSGFTLVELLAVIVILAVILIIAVPRVMDIISNTRKSSFETSIKLIASSAEKKYTENKINNVTEEITCESVAKINNNDYESCEITFDGDVAKVTAIGSGRFDGLKVIYGTKTSVVAITGEVEYIYTLEEAFELINDLTARIEELENGTLTDTSIADLKNDVKENKEAIDNMTALENENNIFLKNYPIGSIYITYENINPKDKFGGTWEQLKNRFLIGAGDKYVLGATGGEETHALTLSEMAKHTHSFTTSSTSKTLTGTAVFMSVVKSSTEGNNLSNIITRADGIFEREFHDSSVPASPSGTTNVSDIYRTLNIDATHTHSGITENSGSGSAHNNMPPYLSVYMWRRIE